MSFVTMRGLDLGSLVWVRNFWGWFQDVSYLRRETSAESSDCPLPIESPLLEQVNKEYKMEAQRRSHTVKSHGRIVARRHMYDWLILLLLIFVELGLNVIDPFYRFVGKDMMSDLKYPLKSNTIPIWVVPIYAIFLPVAIFLAIYYWRRDVYDLHHAILGLLFSVVITGVITDAIKDAVGRPRPDFFWRCFPDGKGAYDKWGNVICHGKKNVIREGHKSFPSGHTSWSFAGLTFLSLYLSGKIKAFDQRGHVAKLCIIVFPLLGACLVGISRVDDYWHHWQDVFAGGLIGLVVAIVCYLQFFPPPYHAQGSGPYSYFKMLQELQSSTEPVVNIPENANTQHDVESQVDANEEGERSEHGFLGLRLAPENPAIDRSLTLEEMLGETDSHKK